MQDPYTSVRSLIRHELIARRDDEGCAPEDVAEFEARFAAIEQTASEGELEELYQELLWLRPRQPRPWEPSDWRGIQEARPDGPRVLPLRLSREELLDKIYGGWLGRAAGCALGKPVEGWTRAEIEACLQAAGEPDLTDFIPYREGPPETLPRRVSRSDLPFCRGHIECMPRDDDMDYTVIGLHVLRTRGPDFTTEDVAALWLQTLPFQCTYTAERVAYKNLVDGYTPPETAHRRNPYRQWIGAQIRADAFGYACPGRPEQAAAMAWRDARLSHVKNGIYGEMWVAAAIAAAFATDDIHEVIQVATAQIPAQSLFAAMVQDVLQWRRECPDWKSCWERIHAKYGKLHRVHTINNAALVLLGLLYGAKDLGKTIAIAVQGGWDTDCNGATAGSVLGVMLGARALPARWVEPFRDTLETAVFGYTRPRFRELAEATLGVALQVLEASRGVSRRRGPSHSRLAAL